jgi:starch-binding outer membrane protein, SusD/RagB family
MHRIAKITGAAFLLAGVVACEDFLSGPGLTEDPNFPVAVSADQVLVGVQGRAFVQMQGQLARTAAIWTQQIGGINNQQRDWGSRYDFREQDINTPFDGVYAAGGLIDIRRLQELAAAAGDTRLQGIGFFWEAFTMGTYTSVWGDMPYREAAIPGIPAPALDPQEQIYADVQARLDDAIALLGPAPSTPLGADVVYNGNTARWVAAAHTLKARYYLHLAPQVGQAAYQNALNHAQQGINEAPTSVAQAIHGQAPGDFRAWHGSTLDDGNIWAQFLEARSDMVANQRMIDILEQRNDPRLSAFHALNTEGVYQGSDQFGVENQPWSDLSAERVNREFRQPFITWAENQLIMAEANYRLGNEGPARDNLNAVRQSLGMPAVAATLSGERLLEEIMVEKWITQFQNIDVYSDWRRTCFPRLIPGGPDYPDPAARVPGRYPYGQTERQQNPNFAGLSPAQQPADNWNFQPVAPCPTGNVGGETYPAG